MAKDKRAEGQWLRSQNSYDHYVAYLNSKSDRYRLTMTDLVFVKNFKGGSATINEPVATFAAKIAIYEQSLRACAGDAAFAGTLATISTADYPRAKKRMLDFASLPNNPTSDINGFGESFASALLHFYFPKVVPILDKRALNGAGIGGLVVNTYNNVKNLLPLYGDLIDAFRDELLNNRKMELRDLDQQWFCEKLQSPPFQ